MSRNKSFFVGRNGEVIQFTQSSGLVRLCMNGASIATTKAVAEDTQVPFEIISPDWCIFYCDEYKYYD